MSAIERAIEKAGGQGPLADAIGVSQGLISQWVNGAPIHQRHFPEIERATDGDVTPQELLADEMVKLQRPKRRRARSN
jgi:DNA-binding transcriptional regulator YdaS (Cro superfamily)